MSISTAEPQDVPSIVGFVVTLFCIVAGLFLILCGGLVIIIGTNPDTGGVIAAAGFASLFGGWILGMLLYLVGRIVLYCYFWAAYLASGDQEIELTEPPV